MDVKIGDWVVTPRIGKPVEVNALWYNALLTMAQLARVLSKPSREYKERAEQVRAGFQQFWNESADCCFDVIEGPDGNDAALRPNQLFAVSLPETPLKSGQQRAVVDVCARHLLASHGIRSLAPLDPRYKGHYAGAPKDATQLIIREPFGAGCWVLLPSRIFGFTTIPR
jgi:predicted glycogen debranching enzyme